mmetsp:Transcript_35318/g.92291  ORF Transcript_35318/g.92291 Transcript_35318/m.92291 type:complete len:212 (-) Transcript_35318:22-657(-)
MGDPPREATLQQGPVPAEVGDLLAARHLGDDAHGQVGLNEVHPARMLPQDSPEVSVGQAHLCKGHAALGGVAPEAAHVVVAPGAAVADGADLVVRRARLEHHDPLPRRLRLAGRQPHPGCGQRPVDRHPLEAEAGLRLGPRGALAELRQGPVLELVGEHAGPLGGGGEAGDAQGEERGAAGQSHGRGWAVKSDLGRRWFRKRQELGREVQR